MLADLGYLSATDEPARDDAGAVVPAKPDARRAPAISREAALSLLGATERQVAARICTSPGGIDTLVAATGFSPGAVAAALTLLQLRGWVQQVGAAYMAAGPLLNAA
jgi:predicted Rossmann fold nucleotide-binding protein DprA/Smf involved in DNA uptake